MDMTGTNIDMNARREAEIEQALKNLSADELEGVLDALTLITDVAGQTGVELDVELDLKLDGQADPDVGLYLVPPYGELIASGEQKSIVKPREYEELEGRRILVSGDKAYGVVDLGSPVVVGTKEFDDRYDEHKVARRDRLRWWPEAGQLYMYPVIEFKAYEPPRDVYVRPGVQTLMDEVRFVDVDQDVDRDVDQKEGRGVEQKETQGQTFPDSPDSPNSPNSPTLPNVPILRIKIARTESQAERGFSGLKSIDPAQGLLIPLSSTKGIWMKDTLVPLNVAFLDSDYKVLSIVDLTPQDETIHLGPAGTRYALEASPSWFKASGIEPGDQILPRPSSTKSSSTKSSSTKSKPDLDPNAIVVASAKSGELFYGTEIEQGKRHDVTNRETIGV